MGFSGAPRAGAVVVVVSAVTSWMVVVSGTAVVGSGRVVGVVAVLPHAARIIAIRKRVTRLRRNVEVSL
jgi:hypothetical protein